MGKRKKPDPLISALEHALDLGEFVSYNRSWEFVQDLENVKDKINALVKDGQADRAVSLYEIFLSGCYEKADEIDDSGGNLGMFFEDLFCAWIIARQKAKYDPAETVQNIVGWMDNDEYGFWNISGKPKSCMKKPAWISYGWMLLKGCSGIIPANTVLSLFSRK